MSQQQHAIPSSLKYFAPAEFKLAAGKAGAWEGYCARFDNVDSGGDVLRRGCFKEIKRTRDGKLLVLLQHRTSDPIGKADIEEDSKGLFVRGQLVMDDPVAANTYARMKAGTLEAMSFGYDVLEQGSRVLANGVRELTGIRLWEASICTWGMNELARIDVVKSAMDCQRPDEFADLLRDTLQISARQAKKLAIYGWRILHNERDDEPASAEEQIKALVDSIQNSSTTITQFLERN